MSSSRTITRFFSSLLPSKSLTQCFVLSRSTVIIFIELNFTEQATFQRLRALIRKTLLERIKAWRRRLSGDPCSQLGRRQTKGSMDSFAFVLHKYASWVAECFQVGRSGSDKQIPTPKEDSSSALVMGRHPESGWANVPGPGTPDALVTASHFPTLSPHRDLGKPA